MILVMSPKLPFTTEVVIMTPTNSTAVTNPMSVMYTCQIA
ncbi:unnamed protein product [Arabidopsis halleri]